MSDTETSDITDATPDTETETDTETGAATAGDSVESGALDGAPAADATEADVPAGEGGDGDVSVEAQHADVQDADLRDAQDVEAQDAVSEDELLASPVVDNPWTRPGRWFVVHTQSGYEKKVKQNLEARIHSMNAEEAVYEVVIPMEDYVDFKNGKRVVNQRKMFPGYLLVRAELDDTASEPLEHVERGVAFQLSNHWRQESEAFAGASVLQPTFTQLHQRCAALRWGRAAGNGEQRLLGFA
jgi:transcriptional antiterminator NusG